MTTGVLDQFVVVGVEETAYGTKSKTLTRAYEVRGDGFERDIEWVEDSGNTRGASGMLANRRRKVDKGAAGAIEHTLLSRGEGLLLGACFGTVESITAGDSKSAVAPSNVKKQSWKANTLGPTSSHSVQVVRSQTSDQDHVGYDYLGGMVTSWSLSVERGGEVMLTLNYDFRTEVALAPGAEVATPVYQPLATMFIWEDCVISIAGKPVNYFSSFNLEMDLGFDVERYFLQGSALKSMPQRSSKPTLTGSMDGEYRDDTIAALLRAGGVSSLQFRSEQVGNGIETKSSQTFFPKFTIDLPAVQFDSASPQMSTDGLSTQSVEFTAVQANVTNLAATPLVTAYYESLDTAA